MAFGAAASPAEIALTSDALEALARRNAGGVVSLPAPEGPESRPDCGAPNVGLLKPVQNVPEKPAWPLRHVTSVGAAAHNSRLPPARSNAPENFGLKLCADNVCAIAVGPDALSFTGIKLVAACRLVSYGLGLNIWSTFARALRRAAFASTGKPMSASFRLACQPKLVSAANRRRLSHTPKWRRRNARPDPDLR